MTVVLLGSWHACGTPTGDLSGGQLTPRSQPNQGNPQRRLVGVLVSGLKEEDVNQGDALQALAPN